MDYKMTVKNKRKWLSDKTSIFIAYKVVSKKEESYYPIWNFNLIPFEKENRLNEHEMCCRREYEKQYIFYDKTCKDATYSPYYHLVDTIKNAVLFRRLVIGMDHVDLKIIKCSVAKKDVAEIGRQSDLRTIVTTSFKIIEEVSEEEINKAVEEISLEMAGK